MLSNIIWALTFACLSNRLSCWLNIQHTTGLFKDLYSLLTRLWKSGPIVLKESNPKLSQACHTSDIFPPAFNSSCMLVADSATKPLTSCGQILGKHLWSFYFVICGKHWNTMHVKIGEPRVQHSTPSSVFIPISLCQQIFVSYTDCILLLKPLIWQSFWALTGTRCVLRKSSKLWQAT